MKIIGHVLTGLWQRMNATEVATLAWIVQFGAQTFIDLVRHFVRVALELFGAVFGQFGDGWLGGVPIACAILIKKSGGSSQAAPSSAPSWPRSFSGWIGEPRPRNTWPTPSPVGLVVSCIATTSPATSCHSPPASWR